MSLSLPLDTKAGSESLLFSIERSIEKSYRGFVEKSEEPFTLLSGLSGCVLFYGYYYKKFQQQKYLEKSNELLNFCLDHISEIQQPSLYQGFTGIAWLIRNLVNEQILEAESIDILDDIDIHIENTVDLFDKYNYYSLMYGLIGHGVYFIESFKTNSSKPSKVDASLCLRKIILALERSAIKTNQGITWIDYTSLDYHDKKIMYNLGLPHGIAGIAIFLSKMIELGIEKVRSTSLLRGCLKWLISRKRNFANISHYPSLIADNEPEKITRLSWAYGDLCSSLALLNGFKSLGDNQFLEESFDTLMITINRDVPNSLIHVNPMDGQINAGICKGSCGIILLYEELNRYFNNQIITDRMNFWINKSFDSMSEEKEIGDFKSFSINQFSETAWISDTGFLEGLTGIGLTFLYLLDHSQSGWKRALLL
ncbi:MAG: hypothetical protein JSS93_04240 [Bacteroidetes bacterium]|nr:hypothetical protein [Bacteroidota bacterium]